MKRSQLSSLIDATIIGVYEKVTMDFGGNDEGEVFLKLDNGETIAFPIGLSSEYFLADKNSIASAENIFDALFNISSSTQIVDIIEFNEFSQETFIELRNGVLLSENILAPHGTGLAGLISFQDIQALEKRHGTNYSRLSQL